MIPGIFVAGTGTDVGKTVTVACILRHLRQRGVDAMVMKPVQTGVTLDDAGRAVAPDIDFVLRAAGLRVEEETLGHLAPCLFEPACSPHLAARLAGRPVRIESILKSARWLAGRHQLLVVEGAGGLMVPFGEDGMMIDLAAALGMPVLLVGHSGLGTINHVLLSLEALRRRQLRVLGVILNDTHPVAEADLFIHDDNARAIESFGAVRVLARIPWLGSPPELARLDQALAACDFLKEL
jgi:dethiobiotin synthase